MFSLFIMPKKENVSSFLGSSEDKLFFAKKEDMFFKRGTYGKSKYTMQCSNCILINASDYQY